jgi:transcriptional regulator with XRE-family HTH domain
MFHMTQATIAAPPITPRPPAIGSGEPFGIPAWGTGDRLRKAREKTGLDQTQFAELIGVSRVSVGHWEAGRREPRTIYLRAWATATSVPACWLATGESCGCDVEPPIGLEPITCALQGDHFPDFVPAWMVEAVSAR